MAKKAVPSRRVAVIGAGKLGGTLIQALLDSSWVKAQDVIATAAHEESLAALRGRLEVKTTLDNAAACRDAHTVFLTVKPQMMGEVLDTVSATLTPRHLVISTAAGVPTRFIEDRLGKPVPVVRTMPNTACLIRGGMTGIASGRHVKPEQLEEARAIFDLLGRTVVLDEKHLDAVTGLSGSGPAFMYMIVEALAEGGLKVGLPRDIATLLAAQTMLGAGRMILETGQHPALLKDAVTTPAGCTIDGILELEEGGLRVTLIKAVVKATQRARELFPYPPK